MLCGVLCCGSAPAADRAAILLAAKTDFLKQSTEARSSYLRAIDQQIKALETAGDAEQAKHLRAHRGSWMLGDISAEEYRELEAEFIPQAHLSAVEAYVTAETQCRKTLATAYRKVIDESLFIKRDDEAKGYQQELDSFEQGRYLPSAMEVNKPKPYEVRRIALEPALTLSATATRIPDELFAEFHDPWFSISGTKRAQSANIDGLTSRDFGKAVMFNVAKDGPKVYRGYFMIGGLEDGAKYLILTSSKTKLTPAIPLSELELDTIYEWSVELLRDAFRIEVRHDGAVVESERVAAPAGTMFGFGVTLRHADTQGRLVVAVE
jgi:hypothetical protein